MITTEVLKLFYNDPKKLAGGSLFWPGRKAIEALFATMALDPESASKKFIVEVPAPGDEEVTKFISYYVQRITDIPYCIKGITDEEILQCQKDIYSLGGYKQSLKSLLKAAEKYKAYEEFLIARRNRRCVGQKSLENVKDYVNTYQDRSISLGISKFRRGLTKADPNKMNFDFEELIWTDQGINRFESSEKYLYILSSINIHSEALKMLFNAPLDYCYIDTTKKVIYVLNFKITEFSQHDFVKKFEESYWFEILVVNMFINRLLTNFKDYTSLIQFVVVDEKGYQSTVDVSKECIDRCIARGTTFVRNPQVLEAFKYKYFNHYAELPQRIVI